MLETYYFYWLDGTLETVKASNPSEALTKLGYGQGSLSALDFYSTKDSHKWDKVKSQWIRK